MIRDHQSKPATYAFWVQGELVAMATDLAEFLEAALALHLLTGMPLLWGAVVAGGVSFALLGLQKWGFRPLEAAITAFVGVIAVCYVIQFFMAKPDASLWTGFVPGFQDTGMLYIAVGILGEHANARWVQVAGWLIAAVIIGLNLFLLGQTIIGA